MNDLQQRVAAMRRQSGEQDVARENYARFLAFQRDENGWTQEEYADYKAKISTLMGKDDAAALNLFPPGLYQTADEARQGARTFWQAWCDMMFSGKKFAHALAA